MMTIDVVINGRHKLSFSLSSYDIFCERYCSIKPHRFASQLYFNISKKIRVWSKGKVIRVSFRSIRDNLRAIDFFFHFFRKVWSNHMPFA